MHLYLSIRFKKASISSFNRPLQLGGIHTIPAPSFEQQLATEIFFSGDKLAKPGNASFNKRLPNHRSSQKMNLLYAIAMKLSQNALEGGRLTPIISGLPDDVALFCLARVPRRYHHLLRCVSKRWRELVCSEDWYSYRRNHGLDEAWIYVLCKDKSNQPCCYILDPSRRCWKPIQGIPTQCLKRKGVACGALGTKMYLLGGCGWLEDATNEVYCYDASTNTWEEVAPMPTARCWGACEALNGKLHAIGGMGLKSSNLSSFDTYDPHSNSWMSHLDPNIFEDIEDSVVLDGKIYIRRGGSTIYPNMESAAYDPSTGTWQRVEGNMMQGWQGPAVTVGGKLYVLDQSSGMKLKMWQKESKSWEVVGRLSLWLTRPPCHLVAAGRRIFVIGKGLCTVVIDLDRVGNAAADGVMVCSSIPKLHWDADVICCKSIVI